MPQVLVTDQYLSDIADAIRNKNGEQDMYTPAQMANAIDALYPEPSGSVTITQNGTFNVKNKEFVIININLPDYIEVISPPNVTEYAIGDTIDYTGMVVKAFKNGGAVWADNNHPDGIIPHSELVLVETVPDENE